jgi:hypothetical protein
MGGGGKGKGGGSAKAPSTQNPYVDQAIPNMVNQLGTLSQEEHNYLLAPATQQGSLANLVSTGAYDAQNPYGVPIVPNQMVDIKSATNLAPQMQGNVSLANELAQMGLSQEQTAYGQSQQDRAQTLSLERGTGLYPSQQAYVNQAVQSGQAAVQQQLASEGLTSSTQNAMLQNQVAQSGAATAGQLIQGNIGLSQSQQQLEQQAMQQGGALALGGASLSQQGLGQLQNLWQSAANQWGAMQQQGFEQALQGYGMIGQFFQGALQPYGYQLQGYKILSDETIANSQLQTQLMTAEQQAQAQGMSGLLGGLGSLFGQGGSGSNLLSGIGGLFGAGAAAGGSALVGGSAAGLSAAGGTAAAGTIADVIGLAFGACFISREVYGIDNPQWMRFRLWLSQNAPNWLLALYRDHGQAVASWMHNKATLKWIVRHMMDFAMFVRPLR